MLCEIGNYQRESLICCMERKKSVIDITDEEIHNLYN